MNRFATMHYGWEQLLDARDNAARVTNLIGIAELQIAAANRCLARAKAAATLAERERWTERARDVLAGRVRS